MSIKYMIKFTVLHFEPKLSHLFDYFRIVKTKRRNFYFSII